MIHAYPLSADVLLEPAPEQVLPADVAERVDALWEAEKAVRGEGLFDGPIFSVVARATGRLEVSPTTFRRLIATRRDPQMAELIGLRPLGVTGLVVGPDGVALGRRSRRLHTEAGRWEPAPAGVVDRLDWRAVLLGEAWEELGLRESDLGAPEPLALMDDEALGVMDLLCRLETGLTGPEIEAAWRAHGSDEYEAVAVVAREALAGFLEAHQADLAPALRPMLAAAGLLV
jgi:hypothetical protein